VQGVNTISRIELNRSIFDWFVTEAASNGRAMDEEEYQNLNIEYNKIYISEEKGMMYYIFRKELMNKKAKQEEEDNS